jgi:ferritin-like metal-binding protein YciE
METLEKLFEETLKDVYFAEKQIIKSLPKMAKKTKTPKLKQAFEEHLEQTKGQVQRLDQIFKLLGKKSSGKECPALLGLVEEAEELMSETKDPAVLDAGLIGCAQAVEHYEIARYGTLRAWAEQLNMPEAAKLLEATLQEEKTTDEKLTKLAMEGMNAAADEHTGRGMSAKSTGAKSPARSTTKTAAARTNTDATKITSASRSAASKSTARKK